VFPFAGLWKDDPMNWKHDPGPCPVDDMPHTTCTSADPLTRDTDPTVTVPLARPGWLREPPPAPVVEHTVVEFTTTSYKRAVHGKKRR